MDKKFDLVFDTLISEMATTLKSSEPVTSYLDRIEKEKLAHHYQKNLMRLKSKAERDKAVEDILNIVFGGKKYNPNIHTRKQLQDALGKAAAQVLGGGKTFNDYLGKWMGTNLDAEIIDTSDEEKGASEKEVKDAVKDVVNDVAAEVTNEEPKTVEDAAQQLKLAAKEETEDSETDKWRKAFGLDKKEEEPKSKETDSEESKSEGPKKELNPKEEYRVFESSYESILEKVQKANKRAYRYGIPQIVVTKTGEEFETVTKKTGEKRTHKLVKFKISQPSPKMNGGWKFIARVDHEKFGNLIVKAPGTDEFEGKLHEMFGNGQPSYCDHCKKKRNRTSTFIVQDQRGALKRIGKACLKDYLPGGASDVQKLIHWGEEWVNSVLKDINILRGSGDDGGGERGGGGGSGGPRYTGIEYTLGLGLFLTKEFGYLSNQNARNNFETGGPTESTADKVNKVLNGNFTKEEKEENLYKRSKYYLDNRKQRKKYEQEAKELLDWAPGYIEAQLRDPNCQKRDYYNNLKIIVGAAKNPQTAYISQKHVAYILSLIPTFKRAKQDNYEAAKAGKKPSEYVGTIGLPFGTLTSADKRKIKKSGANINTESFPYNGPIKLKVTSTRTFTNKGFGYRGGESTAYVTNFEDENGTFYSWTASFNPGLEEGEEVTLERATVKNHNEYISKKTGNAIRQTIIKCPKFEGQAEAE